MNPPQRKFLPHDVPAWVSQGASFFITISCQARETNQLCKDKIAEGLFETVAHRQKSGEWWVRLFLLMPDHCHALLSFAPEVIIRDSLANWKRYAARQFGIEWQRDFFDHRIRNHENLDEKAHYIRMNPVRKGLCEKPDEWRYVWSFKDFSG